MAGPAYQFDRVTSQRGGPHATAWPAYYDNVPLFYEWTRDYVKEFRLNAARDDVIEINDVLATFDLQNPMDLEFGPNGSLYVLNYGNGFFGQNQPGAELVRIDYVGAPNRAGKGPQGNKAPSVTASADETFGLSPLTVSFSADADDPEGQRLSYAWDFDGDGTIDARGADASFTYDENGVYNATVTVTDQFRRSSSDYVEIVVGNTPPTIEFVTPQDGDTFSFGDAVPYEVSVTDDTEVDCSRVQVTYTLGHDTHGHPQSTAFGCSGTITTTLAQGHEGEDNLSGVFSASYTDAPGDGLPSLTATDQVVLTPVP
jgi:PKD repeat protein